MRTGELLIAYLSDVVGPVSPSYFLLTFPRLIWGVSCKTMFNKE